MNAYEIQNHSIYLEKVIVGMDFRLVHISLRTTLTRPLHSMGSMITSSVCLTCYTVHATLDIVHGRFECIVISCEGNVN